MTDWREDMSAAGGETRTDGGHAVAEPVTSLYESAADEAVQRASFLDGEIPVAVYGLGKMGLPLASVFAETCGNVTGADVDPAVVETITDGGCHVKREPGLADLVGELAADDALTATSEPRAAAEDASIHVVIVPTPITDAHEPDLAILDAVVEDIARGLSAGDQVIIECTVPPRTTADRVLPTLESVSGLDRDEFGLAFCPERTSSGRALEDIRGAYPKVVGGVDDESARVAQLIYEEINSKGVLTTSDATTAECVKVFEGLYRDVNIALANELGTYTDELGIDIREAIDVANTQPFCDIHDPGPGVGGHCIPYYPYFLIEPFETDSTLLETARAVNDSMPAYTVEKVRDGLAEDGTELSEASVVVLGLTYRPGVEEIRASPSIPIAEQLSEAGADVYGVDPMLKSFEEFSLEPVELEEVSDMDVDTVVLVTPHDEFESIRWGDVSRKDGTPPLVIDGRDALEEGTVEGDVYTIGVGYDE
ncbi:nucleotide sugar dehydrogenase [Halovivax asiaticus JCM 14624]|uniref:UDP-N-acetyl-D-mannosamine dehydrogenase n=1 Tax=Halovivax asiaticus JCM 14624 TaxID=1227490 RepID=M0BJY1_9EURY|nr:nucleotide sugar dehydrogenase [Halovivax asiaticus]ELZ11160.1 nucleotide sugar dehydrogenase [Halovivax asiaticus JCM 14624]